MEIKINVTSSEEDRKNVELFEFRRRKEEDFKHKIEEQMDSLISQNEEEKLYELADEFLGGFYEENGIEQLYDIDDAEY